MFKKYIQRIALKVSKEHFDKEFEKKQSYHIIKGYSENALLQLIQKAKEEGFFDNKIKKNEHNPVVEYKFTGNIEDISTHYWTSGIDNNVHLCLDFKANIVGAKSTEKINVLMLNITKGYFFNHVKLASK